MGPVACVPLLLFAGFFVKVSSIPWYLRWCSYTSFARYAFEGSVISVYGDRPFNGTHRDTIECEFSDENDFFGVSPKCPLNEPTAVMEYFDIKPTNIGLDCAMLIVFFVALRIIAYLALKFRLRTGSSF